MTVNDTSYNGHKTNVAVRVCGVSKSYGPTRVVNNVSFDVLQGELLTLLGPSGCGKTTTMRSIAGLEKINEGEIFLKDRVVSSIPKRIHLAPEKRDVGMVFQSYAIWPHMNVFENVAYPLRCRKVNKEEIGYRVREGLKLVEMENYEDRPATRLSGGQQQRVALARSMVMRPSVLLLDEPLSSLDAKLRIQMRLHIKELQRRTGLTMIYVTHDQAEAMALSDRIIVMNGGVIEQVGTPEEIYEHPRSEFVADFVGAINFLWGNVVEVRLGQGRLGVTVGGQIVTCALDDYPAPEIGTRILMMIRPEKITVVTDHGERNAGNKSTASNDNCVPAVVAVKTYYGDHLELSVEAAEFAARVIAPSIISVEKGQRVQLEFMGSDLHLLPTLAKRDAVAATGNA
jgi:iron(III) transport system ATP-binding protein